MNLLFRLLVSFVGLVTLPTAFGAELRIGLIGLDSSHVTAFTKLLNVATDKNYVPGGKVVAAYKGGSRDIEASWSVVDGFTEQLQRDYGVKIVDSIEELCKLVDVVMLTSVDGRPHLEQARAVFKAGKPIFIDKPVAGSLRDAIEIYRLAKQHKVPCFSSSALRYTPELSELKNTDVGEIRGATSHGPAQVEPHHPDLFWYGIHPTEALFTIMGTGCETVVRTKTTDTDVVTGVWSGGRVGTLRGLRNIKKRPYRVTVFGTKDVADQKAAWTGDYSPLIREVMKFFQTGISPVTPEETLEIMAFMEAADESERQGGRTVRISDVMKKHGGEGR
jgi:predicted dehydrogenase